MEYVGEVDINGKACGYGIAFSEDRSVKYGGTFWEGQVHGICKLRVNLSLFMYRHQD